MTTTDVSLYESIIENYMNGNRTDAKEQVKKLNKMQLLELQTEWNVAGMSYPHIIGILTSLLE